MEEKIYNKIPKKEIQNNKITKLIINNCDNLDLNELCNCLINNTSIIELNLSNNNLTDINYLCEFLKTNQTIQILCLNNNKIQNIKNLYYVLKYNNNTIKEIKLSNCLNNDDVNLISEIFKYNGVIENIDLSYNRITDIKDLIDNIKDSNTLKYINLNGNSINNLNILFDYLKNNECKLKKIEIGLEQEEFDNFGEIFKYNKSLDTIIINSDIRKIKKLCEGLKNNKTLINLKIYNFLEIDDINELWNILKNNECNLKSLTINPLDDGCVIPYGNGLNGFEEVLKNNKTLTYLNLDGNNIEDIKSLSEGLKYNNTLSYLSLNYNYLDDEEFNILCKSLENNKGLKELYLSMCRGITDLDCLGKLLKINNTLEIIDLSYNEIENIGCLFEGLKNNKTLKKIDLFECGINNLKSKIKKLKTYNNSIKIIK